MELSRYCITCKETKPLTGEFFIRAQKTPLGFYYECKECVHKRKKVARGIQSQTNRKKYGASRSPEELKRLREINRKKKGSDPAFKIKCMISSYKHEDKKRGIECSITVDWVLNNIFNKPCTYCNEYGDIGCDRIDNTKGHIPENIIPACSLCNRIRLDHLSVEEMKKLGKVVREIKEQRRKINEESQLMSTDLFQPDHCTWLELV